MPDKNMPDKNTPDKNGLDRKVPVKETQAAPPLNVVLCWHMHQPEYRNLLDGSPTKPWTYLRAIKDYTDMAAHLEQSARACAVVNFAPILLEQIDDYAQQIEGHDKTNESLRDPLLKALVAPRLGGDEQERQVMLKQCLNGHHQAFSRENDTYAELVKFGQYLLHHPQFTRYTSDRFFYDLIMWYHLAWLGETVRRNDPRVQRLLKKAQQFTREEREVMLSIIGEQISAIIPRYRALAEAGRVELAMSPYAHPLAPLLLEWRSAQEANPDLLLPETDNYPGGEERLRWQIEQGIRVFEDHFGSRPVGCWPAEGALSNACLQLLHNSGFQWAASGAGVLFNSLNACHEQYAPETALYHPYQVAEIPVTCFFRDDQLSDLIGFTYSSWHADDAVANLVRHLEEISHRCNGNSNTVAAIIMDGENAWEHYPNNGFYFLQGLYRRLANHPRLHLTTFSQCLGAIKKAEGRKQLASLVAGSWVYGNLSTWIGSPDKNRAWEMLVEAKHCFDRVVQTGKLNDKQRQAALRQLAVCEGSDWFWWPGGDNPPDTVADFDNLYRMHLRGLYRLLDEASPDYLNQPFTQETCLTEAPTETPLGGVMRKSQ